MERYQIPGYWKWEKLGELCRTTSGGTPSRRNTLYFQGDIPWVKSGELTDGVVTEVEEYITQEAEQNSSAKVFPKGTLLLAMYGATVGKLGILGRDAATNQAICAIFPPSDIESSFLFWFLRRCRPELLALSAGGAQPNISQKIIRELDIPIPYPNDPTRSLAEQRRIVARIEALFAELRGCQQTLGHLQKQTGRLMEAFIEEMVSEFTEHRIPLIEILHSRPRNGWSPKVTDDTSGTPVLRLGAVLNFEYDPSQVKYTALPTEPNAHYWLEPGDVMISRSNTANLVAHASIYNGEPYPCICPDLLMKMKVKKEIADPQFLIYWLQCSEVRKHIASRAKGASPTMKKVNQQ